MRTMKATMITTTGQCPLAGEVRHLGIVSATADANYGGVDEAIEKAMKLLVEKAEEMGAEAIFGIQVQVGTRNHPRATVIGTACKEWGRPIGGAGVGSAGVIW